MATTDEDEEINNLVRDVVEGMMDHNSLGLSLLTLP